MFDDLAGRAVPHSFAGRVDVAREVSTSAQILVRADEVIEWGSARAAMEASACGSLIR
jgi:hypothetical protein